MAKTVTRREIAVKPMLGLEFSRFAMLRFLRVSHLAIIDSLEVEFDTGLNVLTGETGAGKSILVGAVGLLLGGRASADLVRTGEDVATVEALFETGTAEVSVRREVTAQGRSRAFIDGQLASVGALRDLAGQLIELHGQHEHQTLLDPAMHLAVLDAFGQSASLLEPVRARFEAMRASADRLSKLRSAVAEREARLDLIGFQLNELNRAALRPPSPTALAEDDELLAERKVLASAERVARLCEEGYVSLYESDGAVLTGLGQVWRRIAELAAFDPRFEPYVEAREGIKSQLEDLAQFLRRYADNIDASPARLQQVEERLALLERLKRKFGPTLADVIRRRDQLADEWADLQQSDERIAQLEREHGEDRQRYLESAEVLSQARRKAAGQFSRQLEATLAELAMERTRFESRFATSDAQAADENWTAEGIDAVEFYVSTNPGEELRPLARVVSGGELSRIMLAIKVLTFQARRESGERPQPAGPDVSGAVGAGSAVPGMIFDEVDAGIGGRVADVVGRQLHALGSTFQVLCITHLPQIAACADAHFLIDKHIGARRATTTVRRLDGDARVEEIARMLGGATITERLKASAREMLGEGRRAGRGTGSAKPKRQ
jgi:DNA repair protein RecN (Recombination protein N)